MQLTRQRDRARRCLRQMYPNTPTHGDAPTARHTRDTNTGIRARPHWDSLYPVIRELLQNSFDHLLIRKSNHLRPEIKLEASRKGTCTKQIVFKLPITNVTLLIIEIKPNTLIFKQYYTNPLSGTAIVNGVVDTQKGKGENGDVCTGGFGVGFKDAAAALFSFTDLSPTMDWKMYHEEGEVSWKFAAALQRADPSLTVTKVLKITTTRICKTRNCDSESEKYYLVQTISAVGIDKVFLENLVKFSIFTEFPEATDSYTPSIFPSSKLKLNPILVDTFQISEADAKVPSGIFMAGMYVCPSQLQSSAIYDPKGRPRNSNRAEIPLEDVYAILYEILEKLEHKKTDTASKAFGVFFNKDEHLPHYDDDIAVGLHSGSEEDTRFWLAFAGNRSNRKQLIRSAFAHADYTPCFWQGERDQTQEWIIDRVNKAAFVKGIGGGNQSKYSKIIPFNKEKHDLQICLASTTSFDAKRTMLRALWDGTICSDYCDSSAKYLIPKFQHLLTQGGVSDDWQIHIRVSGLVPQALSPVFYVEKTNKEIILYTSLLVTEDQQKIPVVTTRAMRRMMSYLVNEISTSSFERDKLDYLRDLIVSLYNVKENIEDDKKLTYEATNAAACSTHLDRVFSASTFFDCLSGALPFPTRPATPEEDESDDQVDSVKDEDDNEDEAAPAAAAVAPTTTDAADVVDAMTNFFKRPGAMGAWEAATRNVRARDD